MARSLRQVEAFFRGIDDGAIQRRLEEEAAAKRRIEDQNFLFKTAVEQRAIEDQAQKSELFNQTRTARQLAVDKAAYDASEFMLYKPVLEREAGITRTKATFGQNLYKTNQSTLEQNITDAATNKIGQDALGISQAAALLKQRQENPYVFNAPLRAGDAALAAAGVETADSIIEKRGLVLPDALKTAGEVTKMQWLENSGKFLNKTQAEITATQKATELATAKDASAIALIEARYDAIAANAAANAAAKAVEAAKKREVEYPATAAPAAAATPAARPVVPGLSATLPPSAPLPPPAMPTPPAKAAPALVAQPAPILTPGEQAVDNAKVSYVQIQREIEALQPPPSTSSRSRNGTPGQVTSAYLAWQASSKPAQLQAKQAELKRLNDAFAQSLKR